MDEPGHAIGEAPTGARHVKKRVRRNRGAVIAFDEDARKEFLGGFRKRKQQRRIAAQRDVEHRSRTARLRDRKDRREKLKLALGGGAKPAAAVGAAGAGAAGGDAGGEEEEEGEKDVDVGAQEPRMLAFTNGVTVAIETLDEEEEEDDGTARGAGGAAGRDGRTAGAAAGHGGRGGGGYSGGDDGQAPRKAYGKKEYKKAMGILKKYRMHNKKKPREKPAPKRGGRR